jgi:glutathione S-transferase
VSLVYKLVSFDLCPFVQRSIIVLEERATPYEITYIDLADKPAWFLQQSPLGKVPILVMEGEVLFESTAINEYLDEVVPGPRLLPDTALGRAKARAWIEYSTSLLGDSFAFSMAPDEATALRHLDAIKHKFQRLESSVGRGPFFLGQSYSLVDVAFAPALQRLYWCAEIVPELLPLNGGAWSSLDAWAQRLLARPAVKKSIRANLKDTYVQYLKGQGSPKRQVSASWLGNLVSNRQHT